MTMVYEKHKTKINSDAVALCGSGNVHHYEKYPRSMQHTEVKETNFWPVFCSELHYSTVYLWPTYKRMQLKIVSSKVIAYDV